ncbi:SpoIIE family protein phosphatase [Clostridiaceae bacterium OttesenSCG-928-D20]|nr:SpoIIE family protein phosphatase [Clostridiaceae bacterium OttesenSCG-928-D20]
MAIKTKLLSFKQSIKDGSYFYQRKSLSLVLAHIFIGILAFTLSTARIMGDIGPFGIGFIAANSGGGAIAALVGAALGYIVSGGFDWGVRYIASCMLVFTAAFVLREFKIYKTSWFMPMITATLTALTNLLNIFEYGGAIPAVVLMLTEVLLAGGSAYFFALVMNSGDRATIAEEKRHGVALLILASSALMGVSSLEFFGGISVGRIIAVVIIMLSSLKGGSLSGAATGVSLGLAMDISAGRTPIYAMAYAFSGLVSGVFSKNSKLFFLLSFVLSNAASVLWTWGAGFRTELLFEVFIASVIVMMMPSKLIGSISLAFYSEKSGGGEGALREYMSGRLARISAAFNELYESVRRSIEDDRDENDIAVVFDRAADAVCVKCPKAADCWQKNYMDTLSAMNDATKAMASRGSLEIKDLPARFTESCKEAGAFIQSVNSELRGLMYRRSLKSRMTENRRTAISHWADFSEIIGGVTGELSGAEGSDSLAERRLSRYLQGRDIEAKSSVFRDSRGRLHAVIETGRLRSLVREPDWLDKLSAVLGVRLCRPAGQKESEGRLVLLEAEPLTASVGISAVKKKGEPVSGDRGTYFKTENGTLCVILSDGMGSGADAARESIEVIQILERFLRSGVRPQTAMKMLNSVMLLRNGDDWGYATVDLMVIDLFTGEACFYKYGAAPSYVRDGKHIKRVGCKTLAPGLFSGEGALPDVIRMNLRPGSLALVASDGVLAEDDDSWLKRLMLEWEGADAKALAGEALKSAIREYGCEDDMTVLAISLEKRI